MASITGSGPRAVSSNTSAHPKVTAPRPASLSLLNRRLPLNMNLASLSPMSHRATTWRAKEHSLIICLFSAEDAPLQPIHTLNQDEVYKQNETECISSKFQTQCRGKRSGNLLMEWKLQLVPYFASPGKEINNCRGWICYATMTTIPKKAFFSAA